MRIDSLLTDEAVQVELGARLARSRLALNLTQTHLAREAGVARGTVQRAEAGEPVATTALIRILRALNLLDGLDAVVPERVPSPLEQLEYGTDLRRRASAARRRRSDPSGRRGAPRWGTT